MGLDQFLSGFLFYITVLTIVVALNRMLTDLFMEWSKTPQPIRSTYRRLSLLTAITLAFTVALGSDASLRLIGFQDGAVHESFLLARASNNSNEVESAPEPLELRPSSGTTAVELIGLDQISSLSQSILFGGLILYRTYAGDNVTCDGLAHRASMWSIEIKPGKPRSSGVLIICAGDPVNWSELTSLVENKRTHLLYVGAPSQEDKEHLGKILNVDQWRAATKEPNIIAFGGEKLSYGGFPAGLEMYFSWTSGFPLAKLGGLARLVETVPGDHHHLSDWGAVALSRLGSSRVGWSSLPLYLWGKSDSIYGAHLDFVWMRIFQHMFGLPSVGLRHWPSGAVATRTPYASASSLDLNAKEVLRNEAKNLTEVIGPWDANAEDFKQADQSSRLVAAQFIASDINSVPDPQLRRQEMIRWRGRINSISKMERSLPLFIDPWHFVSASTLISAAEAGFHFVMGGSATDRQSPTRWTFVPNGELIVHWPEWRTQAAKSREGIVWHVPSHRSNMSADEIRFRGASLLEDNSSALPLELPGGTLEIRADKLINWMEARSSTSVNIQEEGSRLAVRVKNEGSSTVDDLSLHLDPQDWQIQGGMNLTQEFKQLKSGEVRSFLLEKIK